MTVDPEYPLTWMRSAGSWDFGSIASGDSVTLNWQGGPTPQIRWLGFLATSDHKDAEFKFVFNTVMPEVFVAVPYHNIVFSTAGAGTTGWIPLDIVTPMDTIYQVSITHFSHSSVASSDFRVLNVVEVDIQDLALYTALHFEDLL